MPKGSITGAQVAQYDEDGYVLIRQMFDCGEIDLLAPAAREDRALDEHSFGRSDGESGTVRLSLWNHPGDTIYGMVGPLPVHRRLSRQTARRRGSTITTPR
jgi:ectoine hydroxylase